MKRLHPRSTLFPYTTLFRSTGVGVRGGAMLRGWKGAAFKGWTIISQITAGSGLPETPTYVQAIQGTGSTGVRPDPTGRSEEHTSELQSRRDLVCRLLLEKKN